MTIRIDIAGARAIVAGPGDAFADAIADTLRDNGAAVARHSAPGEAESADIAIVLALEATVTSADVEIFVRDFAACAPAGGCVVVVASALGLVPAHGEAAESVRAAGILALARTLALECAAAGVRVNAVAVGPRAGAAGITDRMLSHTPLRRGAHLGELVAATLFLADPANSYMTGHVLAVDGGWSVGFARDF